MKTNQLSSINDEQHQLTNRMRRLKRDFHELSRALKDHGVPEAVISKYRGVTATGGDPPSNEDDVVDSKSSRPSSCASPLQSSATVTPEPIGPPDWCKTRDDISNRDNWFVDRITRERVEELLSEAATGTFLIRRSTDGSKLVLSVR